MKIIGKKNLKIIAATAMTIFSLFAATLGAFAWFVGKIQDSKNAEDFIIYHDDSSITTLSCYAIKYDGVYGAMAKRLVTGGDNEFKMSEYDYILRDKNINTPLFLRVEITGFDTSKDLQIEIPCNGSYKVSGQNYINPALSNVVCSKFSYGLLVNNAVVPDNYVLTENEIVGGDVKTIYMGMRDRVSSIEGIPFVKSATQKDNFVQLYLDHTSLYQSSNISSRDVDGDGVNENIVVIYLVFDYYETGSVNLVEDYVNSYDGTGLDYSLTFNSDIGLISLRDVEAN